MRILRNTREVIKVSDALAPNWQAERGALWAVSWSGHKDGFVFTIAHSCLARGGWILFQAKDVSRGTDKRIGHTGEQSSLAGI